MNFILQWIDLIFLPLTLFAVKKDQRIVSAAFIIFCMITMRMQVELINSTGYGSGFLGLMKWDAFSRGIVTYSFFYIFYIIITIYSPNTKSWILSAAALSLYFAAFFTSIIIMLL